MVDYFSSHLWLFWTLICVLALILEVSTGTFYLMCFAMGAFVSIIFSFFGAAFWLEVLVFLLFSTISIFLVRPLVLKYLHSEHEKRASNAGALIGREGIVAEDIRENAFGYVKIDGDLWRAVTADGSFIPQGEIVRVVKMKSIIVTVEPV